MNELKLKKGNYYTLTESNGADEVGFTFKCSATSGKGEWGKYIWDDGKSYDVIAGWCKKATKAEIKKVKSKTK